MSGVALEKIHLWLKGGRPDAESWRVIVCPVPTSVGMLEPRIFGSGSSTATVWVVVVQPPALQAWRVTCLMPGVEKVTVGFCEAEVAARASAQGNTAREERIRALRTRDCTHGYDRSISSSTSPLSVPS